MKYILLVLFLVIMGCTRTAETVRMDNTNNRLNNLSGAGNIVQQIVYVQDERSQLCFAYAWYGFEGSPVLTNVPCEAVKDLLGKP